MNDDCLDQACSQGSVPGVAKVSWRNHVVQNIRACFIPYAITIKWIMHLREKIDLASMLQRSRLSLTKIPGNISP